jgi:translation initiation factor IF-1
MVKNTTGGNKAKGFARKNQSNSNTSNEKLRLPTCDLEKYGCVTKMFGNGMCEIYLNDNTRLIGHIRNKFSGGRKRNNLITVNSLVMIGLREWENPIKNCDILCIVDDNELEQIKQHPQIEITNLIHMKLSHESHSKDKTHNDNVIFTYDVDNEVSINPQPNTERFNLETIDEVDIADI